MNWNVESISQVLNRKRIRATYGAVAAIVGCNPQNVMQDRPNNHQNSWIVNGGTNLPTGYGPQDHHPDLVTLPIIVRDPKKLRRILEREPVAG